MNRLSWIAVILAGCGAFAPMAGIWSITDYTVTENTCGTEDTAVTSGSTYQLVETDAGWDLVLDADNTAHCTLDKKVLTCEPLVNSTTMKSTTLTLTMVFDGTFADEETFDGNETMDMACEGDLCDQIASYGGITFPCGGAADFGAEYTSDVAR